MLHQTFLVGGAGALVLAPGALSNFLPRDFPFVAPVEVGGRGVEVRFWSVGEVESALDSDDLALMRLADDGCPLFGEV